MSYLRKINKEYLFLFLINFFLLLPLMVFAGQNFSVDSYKILFSGSNVHIEAFIGSYRFFGALIYKLFTLGGHNPILNSTGDSLLFITLISMSSSFLTTELVKTIDKKDFLSFLIVNVSVLISVVNVWFCSILSFPECIFICAVGFCLCFAAIVVYIRMQTIAGYLLSGVLLICSMAVYQQFIAVFTIYIILVCGIKMNQKNDFTVKSLFIQYFCPCILIICSGLIYFILGKIISNICEITTNSRIMISMSNIFENIWYYITHIHSYLKGRGYYSTDILTISYFLLGLIWGIFWVFDWIKNKKTLKSILLALSYIAALFAAFLPGFLTDSFAPRVLFALFSVFSLLAIGIINFSDKKHIKIIVAVILIIVYFINVPKIVECELNLKKQNEKDGTWAMQVVENIENYEQINGISIEKIVYCNDTEPDLTGLGNEYIRIVLANNSNAAMSTVCNSYAEGISNYDHAIKYILNYYADRKFVFENISSSKYDEYFSSKNWETFSAKDQMLFEDGVLYLCVY